MDDRAGLSISRMAPAKHSDVSLVPQRSRVPRVRVHYHREPAEQYPPSANFTIFNVTLDGSYQVTGTYATCTPTTHSTYDSTTSSGNGNLGSGNGLPKCSL